MLSQTNEIHINHRTRGMANISKNPSGKEKSHNSLSTYQNNPFSLKVQVVNLENSTMQFPFSSFHAVFRIHGENQGLGTTNQ